MANRKAFRSFVVIDRDVADSIPGFIEAYSGGADNPQQVAALIDPDLAGLVGTGEIELAFPSLAFPSRRGAPDFEQKLDGAGVIADLQKLVVAFATDDPQNLAKLSVFVQRLQAPLAADLPFAPADFWCAGAPVNHHFGEREAAKRLIGAEALAAEGLTGQNVQVVIVDHGLSQQEIVNDLNGNFGGGWAYCPGAAPPCKLPGQLVVIPGVTDNSHGMMIARNVLSIAPQAVLHDVPLIPQRIPTLEPFLSEAYAVFHRIHTDIKNQVVANATAPWILVNAWGIFDRMNEIPPGDFTTNPHHVFNLLIADLVDHDIDVVFAAGNCGQFCPDPRAGLYDRGPGKSIFGANAHSRVLSVAAARTDGLWIGSSSQGPGPEQLSLDKPDLAAPSMFSESTDRHTRNGGTSAASAMAAGVLAALRQQWPPGTVSPDAMRACLRDTARPAGLPPNTPQRYGAGILDAGAAMQKLKGP